MSGPNGLFADGRVLSDQMQDVTVEVFGERESMGLLTQEMRAQARHQQTDIHVRQIVAIRKASSRRAGRMIVSGILGVCPRI